MHWLRYFTLRPRIPSTYHNCGMKFLCLSKQILRLLFLFSSYFCVRSFWVEIWEGGYVSVTQMPQMVVFHISYTTFVARPLCVTSYCTSAYSSSSFTLRSSTDARIFSCAFSLTSYFPWYSEAYSLDLFTTL